MVHKYVNWPVYHNLNSHNQVVYISNQMALWIRWRLWYRSVGQIISRDRRRPCVRIQVAVVPYIFRVCNLKISIWLSGDMLQSRKTVIKKYRMIQFHQTSRCALWKIKINDTHKTSNDTCIIITNSHRCLIDTIDCEYRLKNQIHINIIYEASAFTRKCKIII